MGREFGLLAFDKGLLAVEVGVVAGRESLPTACARRVLARRASGEQQEQREAAQGPYGTNGFDGQSGLGGGYVLAVLDILLKLRQRLFIALASA